MNDGNGQSYGYINYRKELSLADGDRIKIRGHVRDTLQLMVDGVMINQPVLTYDDIESGIFGVWSAGSVQYYHIAFIYTVILTKNGYHFINILQ